MKASLESPRPRAARGCLILGACGDAYGGPFENRAPGADEDDGWALLSISDDSQLTLATCEALITQGPEPAAIARSLTDWHRQRRFSGLGASTRQALDALILGAPWTLSGARGERAAGNGAAIRAAPLAFVLDPAKDEDRTRIRDIAWITHQNDEAAAGALAVVAAVRAAWRGEPIRGSALGALPDCQTRDALRRLSEAQTLAEARALCGDSGHVAASVPLALFAAEAMIVKGFEETLGPLCEGGGDADSIAAMAGQVAGARLGPEAVSEELWSRVMEAPIVERVAAEFAAMVSRRTSGLC